MSFPKYIVIAGKRIAWREILALRREQSRATRLPEPTLFPLREDSRPTTERDARTRFEEPSLLPLMRGDWS